MAGDRVSTMIGKFAPRVWMTDVIELGVYVRAQGRLVSFPIQRLVSRERMNLM